MTNRISGEFMAETNDKNELQGSAKQDFEDVIKAEELARRRARTGEKKLELAITSLMDIMTIMLVFLLVSITSDPLQVKESAIMMLSRSAASFPAAYTIPIQVNKKEILVDGKRAVVVSCKFQGRDCSDEDLERTGLTFMIDPLNKEHNKRESLLIVPLKEKLEKAVKDMKDQNLTLKEEVRKKYEANQGVATILCDRDIPFRMIAEVVYTVAMAELHDIRFAVVYTESR